VTQTYNRPVHIQCNKSTGLPRIVRFLLNRPVFFTDFRKLRSSPLVYSLTVYNLYKNSLGLHSGVVAFPVSLAYNNDDDDDDNNNNNNNNNIY
jgi:hypothetical protein